MRLEFFWERVTKSEGCWLWTGYLNPSGYGQMSEYVRTTHGAKVQAILAHRFSYELHKGSIPKGLHVLHNCDVRACVNPEHLRVGTNAENVRDVPFERWSQIRKKQWAKVSPERKAEIKKKMWAGYSPEQRIEIARKIAKSNTGKAPSTETREKMRLAKLGKPAKISDEAKARQRASMKAAWVRRKNAKAND